MGQEFARLRVLLVEHQAPIAADIANILSQQGCVVLGPVPTIEAAIDLNRTSCPDLVITNITLRACMAHPLLQKLNERGVPYIVMTGGPEDAAFSHTEGALFLQKPIEESALIQALRAVVSERERAD